MIATKKKIYRHIDRKALVCKKNAVSLFSVKIYRKRSEVLVAVADSELIGKTFRGNGMKIEVTESFYFGDFLNEEAMISMLRIATIANLVGKRCISAAQQSGIVDSNRVLFIGDVPHAQVFCMHD